MYNDASLSFIRTSKHVLYMFMKSENAARSVKENAFEPRLLHLTLLYYSAKALPGILAVITVGIEVELK